MLNVKCTSTKYLLTQREPSRLSSIPEPPCQEATERTTEPASQHSIWIQIKRVHNPFDLSELPRCIRRIITVTSAKRMCPLALACSRSAAEPNAIQANPINNNSNSPSLPLNMLSQLFVGLVGGGQAVSCWSRNSEAEVQHLS